jgi:hypothetical protein
MLKKIFFFLIQCSLVSLCAQEIPLGQFKEYLPYNKFRWVAQDSENIYAATTQSILVMDKSDGSFDKWSKLNGLSEVGIQTIYADTKDRLFVAYTNSNIDIIVNYKIHNIRDVLNKQVTGSKTINNFFSSGDLAYISCDFGVVILDLKTFLVKDSWFTIRQNITYRARSITIHNEHYFLATDKGVFSLPLSASNPADFSQWKQEKELSKSSYKLLCSYQDKLFAVRDANSNQDSLFTYQNSHWNYDNSIKSMIRNFEIKNDKLLVCCWNLVKIFTGSASKQYTWEPAPPNVWQNGYCATFDDKMNIWVADLSSGLVQINTEDKSYEVITAEGPANNSAYNLYFSEGILALVPGARETAIVPNWNAPAISILQDDHWWSHSSFGDFFNAKSFNSVVINPLDKNEIYMASWNGGLFRINKETNEKFWYNSKNSLLKSVRADSIVFLSGLAIDKQNNLWMAQTEVPDFVKVKDLKTKDEKWYSINFGSFFSKSEDVIAEHILVDSRNYKWITFPRHPQRLIVFFENGSLDNSAGYKKAEVNLTAEAKVPGSTITCIAEDREGRIWIGSNQGIKVVYDAASVFNRTVYAKNVLLEQNGYVQILFEYEYVTCIAVDAADRKWIGTSTAGVFLLSPSGTQELLHFTTDNSPLFSNRINDIKINPDNGEVFIATPSGLISYKGTATTGKENYKEVLVYPNPVREDYYGPVAVKGLMEDSFCKITDAAGHLVWQGYAYGGQLIWNGKDFYGKRPATGVYFVMASNKSGKEKKVAKFLFIQ